MEAVPWHISSVVSGMESSLLTIDRLGCAVRFSLRSHFGFWSSCNRLWFVDDRVLLEESCPVLKVSLLAVVYAFLFLHSTTNDVP